MPKDCNDFYKYWEPVYDFKDIAEVPATEAEYIMGIVDIEDINELDVEDINSFLNGYHKFIDRWGSHNGPED